MESLDPLFLAELTSQDTLGNRKDLRFLSTFEWLVHTRMSPQVVFEGENWYVDLIFVHRASSLCFFRRRMKQCVSRSEALQLQRRYRGIAAPASLPVPEGEAHSICPN